MELSTFKWVGDDARQDAHLALQPEEIVDEHGVPLTLVHRHLHAQVNKGGRCSSLSFTLLLVCSYAVVVHIHDDTSTVRAVQESLSHDLFSNTEFAFSGNNPFKTLTDVDNRGDFWSWCRLGLFPRLFEDEQSWLVYNSIIGGVRMTQERRESEDCNIIDGLDEFYELTCEGLGYETEPEGGRAQRIRSAEPVWFYLHFNNSEMTLLLLSMEAAEWFDRRTKKIEITIPIYNAEFALFTVVYVNFFVSPGGHVWHQVIPSSTYATWFLRWYYWIPDCVWLFCVFHKFVAACADMNRLRNTGGSMAALCHFWRLFDWFSLLCSLCLVCIFVIGANMSSSVDETIGALAEVHPEDFKEAVTSAVEQLETTTFFVYMCRVAAALYTLVIAAQLFKVFDGQPRLAIVTRTLSHAAKDLVHFLIVCLSVAMSFAIAGVVLFGREVSSFVTFPRACLTCFRMLFYQFYWDELSLAGRYQASVWLTLFIIIVALGMLNMLIAQVIEHYERSKHAASSDETVWAAASNSLQRWSRERFGGLIRLDTILKAVTLEKEKVSAGFSILVVRSEDLQGIVFMHARQHLSWEQAEKILVGSVTDYYRRHCKKGTFTTLENLTSASLSSVQNLLGHSLQTRSHHQEVDETALLRSFLEEFYAFTDEVRREREHKICEVKAMRQMKRELLAQLECED